MARKITQSVVFTPVKILSNPPK